jgi:diphthine synthase
MLYLIGLGIWDEKDISLRGIEICKKADQVCAELYTAAWGGSLKNLEKIIGKTICVLHRKDVEEEATKLILSAKKNNVVLLVPGDPLVATTHSHLLAEAKKAKIPFQIVHSSSVYTAIAKTGLQIYKFGRTVTVPAPQKDYAPTSFYDMIAENKKSGLHTLVLLDIKMGTKEGLELLLEIENQKKKNILSAASKVIISSALGSKNEKIIFGKVSDLTKRDLKPPAVIIIPGNLHFAEEEFLENL